MSETEEARESLKKIIEALPLKLDEEQKTVIEDAIYDFTNNILSAVYERYHVVSK